MPRPKAKQVRLAEVLNTEFTTPSPVSSAHASSTVPSAGGVASEPMHHEASVVHRLSVPLHEALSQPTQRDDLMQCPPQGLAEDKYSVGALDSACNRTCCGPAWMDTYLKSCQSLEVLELLHWFQLSMNKNVSSLATVVW